MSSSGDSLLAAGLLFLLLLAPVQSEAGTTRLVIPLYAGDGRLDPVQFQQVGEYLTEDDIVVGKRMPGILELAACRGKARFAVIRQSIADLEADVEFMQERGIRVDYLCYNPEMWKNSHTPEAEKADLVGAAKEARELAARYGAKLILITDSKRTLPTHGAAMARYADIFAVQLQAWQSLPPAQFREKAMELIGVVRKESKAVPVVVQISTSPPSSRVVPGEGKVYDATTAREILDRIDAVRDLVDGVGFLMPTEKGALARLAEVVRAERVRP